MTEKVFVIGFQKTGTTSMGAALEIMGYHLGGGFRVNHPRGVPIPLPITQAKLADAARSFALRADAFEDNPWPIVFREMDEAFPGSKFILTRRDPGSWINSMIRHYGDQSNPMHNFIYGKGTPIDNETEYVCRYQRHVEDVLAHFANRPTDLLVLNLENVEWPFLCNFLNRPIPDVPFPNLRKSVQKESAVTQILDKVGKVFGRHS